MSFTYVLTTDLGKIRLNIDDRVSASAVFSDEELQAFLDQSDANVDLATARALFSIATTQSLLAKRIQAGNYSEDSSAVSQRLMELAKMFAERANAVPAEGDVEFGETDFAFREFLQKSVLRGDDI